YRIDLPTPTEPADFNLVASFEGKVDPGTLVCNHQYNCVENEQGLLIWLDPHQAHRSQGFLLDYSPHSQLFTIQDCFLLNLKSDRPGPIVANRDIILLFDSFYCCSARALVDFIQALNPSDRFCLVAYNDFEQLESQILWKSDHQSAGEY